MELRGMFDDSIDKANQPADTWSTNTRNIVITKDTKAVSNEGGFVVYAENFPETNTPIGYCSLYNDEVLVFSIFGNYSEIGKINNAGQYNLIVRDEGFGFTEDHPVTATKQYNIKGELEVVFTDNNVPPYILNIDTLPFQLDGASTILPSEMINNARLFPEMVIPKFVIDKVNTSGGVIDAGTIFFTGQYVDYNNAVTNYFPISTLVPIFNSTGSYISTVGTKTLLKTSNSVSLNIEGIDTRFKKIKLAVVKRINNQYYAEEFNEVSIDGPTKSITYTGAEPVINLSLSEVLVDKPTYDKVASVLSNSDTLYLANVHSKAKINIQRYVNSWKVSYGESEIVLNKLPNSHKDAKTISIKRPFMHNEVYDMYAIPVMLDGGYGGAFHIPGRVASTTTVGANVINETAVLGKLQTSSADYLNVDDAAYLHLRHDYTISPEEVKYFQTRDTSKPDGTLGYWENQNETYPNTEDWLIEDSTGVVGDLRNAKVRHHKTPTIKREDIDISTDTHTHDVVYLKVENIYLPEEVWLQISHIEIFYAKRTGANSTLAGRAMLYFGSSNENDLGSFNGGNFTWFNTDYGYKEIYDKDLRFHPFDMLIDKTNVLPTYVYNNYKITSQFYQMSMLETDNDNDINYNTNVIIDMTTSTRNVYSDVVPENTFRKLIEQQYLPYNTIIDEQLSNRYNQESFYAKLDSPGYAGINTFELDHSSSQMGRWHSTKRHEAYLSDLCVWREDCYFGYDKQELVSTGARINESDSAVDVWGGDAFVGRQEYVLTAANGFKHKGKESGITTVNYVIYNETANNASLSDNLYSTGKIDWVQLEKEVEFSLVYNKDYTAINTLNPVYPYDPNALNIESFPNRIMRSNRSNREEKVSSWRIFLPNNYFESSRDRGAIVNIEAINGEILIHHEYGLYITRGQDTLQTTEATIEVGSGDIFAREPREILDSQNGYVGTQHKFSCHKFKGGYISVDAKQGKVFIMDESLKELSNEGMYEWFRDKLIGNNIGDNPFTGTGITSVYDENHNRILLSNTGTNPFTISYSLENKGWTCMHDYIPNGMIATATRLLSIKNNKFYRYTPKVNFGKYYGNTYPSYIEFVKNSALTKQLASLVWKTKVINPNGVVDLKKSFDVAMLYNENECSGNVPLMYMKNIRNAEGLWRFNDFRDLVRNDTQPFLDGNGAVIESNINRNKPFFKKRKLFGDYLCIRLIFNNLNNTQQIVLSEFVLNDKVSYR